jgi:Co/Zn/Cd efflux system component
MYLHVLADSLTSVLAILALVLGRAYGWLWLDPAIGLVGGAVIAVWSVQLIRASGRVLLDRQDSTGPLSDRIRHLIEGPGTRIADLRIWRIGPAQRAVVIEVESGGPASSEALRARLAGLDGIAFLRIEVTGPPSPRLQ